jgi:hypothetical protein
MLHRLRFALALVVLLASMASPASAQLTDGAPAPRVSFHFLVRHVDGHAVTNRASYRQAPRTVGLWQPPHETSSRRLVAATRNAIYTHTRFRS